jgi:protein gp37
MATLSTIEWTDSTWNPVVGCTKVSEGCRHCYAERMARRLAAMAEGALAKGINPGRTANYLAVINGQGRWNNTVFLDDSAVDAPCSWREPRIIFVNSMSDLFHEDVPLSFVRRVFQTMNRCPQHTFQILTKRPERVAEWSSLLDWSPNIWMGASIEDSRVLHRVAALRKVSADVRFLSIEPLIGPINRLPLQGIHWVIVGGESGPGARPIRPEWVRTLRDLCVQHGVPFFFKQWGGVNKKAAGRLLDGRTWDQLPNMKTPGDLIDAT